MTLPARHSDWWQRVPECLTQQPQERWRGAPPSGAADPRWVEFQERRLEHREAVFKALADLWDLDPAPDDVEYWRSMAVNLLELFPAIEVLEETRGKKRQRVVEVESADRRARRERSARK